MWKASNTEQRVAHILERMQKAMPETKRQIEIIKKILSLAIRLKCRQ
jgi:hypothetical protein